MNTRYRDKRTVEITHSLQTEATTSPIISLLNLAQLNHQELEEVEDEQYHFNLLNFCLGDVIASYVEDISTKTAQTEQNAFDLYLISQGRVRLLCEKQDEQRPITAALLEENAIFGADSRFVSSPLPCRAVAASPVQIVQIPAATIASLTKQYPQLQDYLCDRLGQQEKLIFFRSLTEFGIFSSHQLQSFTSDITEQQIPAGSKLAEFTPGEAGHYWLRKGSITEQQQDSVPAAAEGLEVPEIGGDWGYPDATSSDWIAETELRVYHMPIDRWIAAKAIPGNSQPVTNGSNSGLSDRATPARKRRDSSKAINYLLRASSPAKVATEASQNGANSGIQSTQTSLSVEFPKPSSRRLLDVLDRYPWVEQQSSSDCGAACLSMVSRYWGKQFPIHVLREYANVGRSGASLRSLAKAAERLGFHARPVRASLGRIAEQRNPWIAHWEGTHYVVVYRITKREAIIADPAVGRRSISLQEFQAYWTGYALLLDPTDRLHSTDIKQASLNRYVGALLPYRSLTAQIVLFSVLIQLFGLITPLFTQIILDQVVVQGSLSVLNILALGLLLFSGWSIAMGAVRQYLLSYLSNRLDLTLISGFVSYTLTLPLKFFEARRVGDIITRVQENQKIQRFLVEQVLLSVLNFVTGFVYLALMFYYNWRLTLLVLALIPPIALLMLLATPMLRRISREVFKDATDQSSVLVEMLTGISTIKSAAAERELRWRWEDHLTSLMNSQFRGQKLGIKLQLGSSLINMIGSTALFWYGAMLVIQGQLTIGQLIAFNMMLGYVISPVLALIDLWDELQEVLISVERLNDVFESSSEEADRSSLLTLPPLQGEVQFEDVTFRYDEDAENNTLQNLSFTVRPGETIAIVGRSGSGKSTLVKLLQGLYHPSQGRIIIDGHDIRHVALDSLRSQLGVVPQDCFLFSGSILENIALYRPEHSLEQVMKAANLAEAHAFIQSLPLGYNTKVGERGSLLSAGQRQRIAIARALLSDPQILILDEATSALDTESERRFQQNLTQIRRDRTTFVIAHRLSTVRNADRILVLDRGVLVEQGTHEALVQSRGLYYYLAQQQLDL
ncbi:MAG TPA: ABC transporter transmembrane domain-containing protein [Trichocoleus sp.]|jgi:ATP-binding cassette subfamily B protein